MSTGLDRDERWWLIDDDDERQQQAWAKAIELHSDQGTKRHQKALDCLALYDGEDINGLRLVLEDCTAFNVVQQCVDTRANHVYRNKVRPMFLTEGGSYEDQQKAAGMQRLVEGEFYRVGIYGELGVDVCWDGEVWEAGGVKIYPDYDNQRVAFERVFPWEVLVDERDARKGSPTVLCHVHYVDRAVLKALYPDHDEDIDMCSNEGTAPSLEKETVSDQVMVVEWWHLPSTAVDRSDSAQWELTPSEDEDDSEDGPNVATHDGRHIICVEKCTLFEEAWPHSYFPIAWYKPERKRTGYWSRSCPEALIGSQLALNRMAERFDQALHLYAVPRLYANRAARIDTNAVSNELGVLIEGTGPASTAIQQINIQSMPTEFIQRYERIIQQAKEQRGISELSAAAKKPAGIESKVALQHLSDTEAIRHTAPFRAWERFHLDAAKMTVDAVRMLAKDSGDYEVAFADDDELVRIKWSEVDLEDDRFVMKVWPTNLLSQEPAAKLEQVLELSRNGIIDQQQMKLLLDMPDLKAAMSDSGAERKNIERKLDAAAKGDAARSTPTPYMNLAMAQLLTQRRLNQLEADGAPEDVLDRLRQFREDVEELIQKAAPPPAAAEMGSAPQMPPPGPGGPPMPPPPGM